MLLTGGDLDTGSITTTSSGQIDLADASMFEIGGGGDDGEFDPDIVLGMAPIATHGSIDINGPVATGRLQAAAGGDLTLNDAAVGSSAELLAGGTANFFGTLGAPEITVTSRDPTSPRAARSACTG